jgi:hypothetical protein
MILGRILGCNLAAAVSRSVVRNYQFKVGEVLSQNGFYRRMQKPLTVIDG